MDPITPVLPPGYRIVEHPPIDVLKRPVWRLHGPPGDAEIGPLFSSIEEAEAEAWRNATLRAVAVGRRLVGTFGGLVTGSIKSYVAGRRAAGQSIEIAPDDDTDPLA